MKLCKSEQQKVRNKGLVKDDQVKKMKIRNKILEEKLKLVQEEISLISRIHIDKENMRKRDL